MLFGLIFAAAIAVAAIIIGTSVVLLDQIDKLRIDTLDTEDEQ